MSWTITHEEEDLLAQAHQSEQTMQKDMEWMGVSPLAQLRMRQHRYASLIISPLISRFLQLHFNLTDATHWTSHYNGFSYEEFYEFIIDFFEADTTPEGQEASVKLLEWWNRYFSNFILTPSAADRDVPRAVFPRSAATRAAIPNSTRQTSLTILRRQRQAARPSNPL